MVRFLPEDPIMSDRDDLLTATELADRLRVKPSTVLDWHRAGRIPSIRLTTKVLRFNLGDVLAALNRSAAGEGVAQ
jgi:excisionase family DNA binding protein